MGAPRVDHGVATSLADRERAICRVAGFGDFVQNARSGKPQNADRRFRLCRSPPKDRLSKCRAPSSSISPALRPRYRFYCGQASSFLSGRVGPPEGALPTTPAGRTGTPRAAATDADQQGTDGVVAMNAECEAGPPDLLELSRRRPLLSADCGRPDLTRTFQLCC
jgi:hypothetical protein